MVVEQDVESRGSPVTHTCNGSARRKGCKHQSKREQQERKKELLKQQEETQNHVEEGHDSEGEETYTELKPQNSGYWRVTQTECGETMRTSSGQEGEHGVFPFLSTRCPRCYLDGKDRKGTVEN